MISTAWYMIVFRTVHILAGVVWVGSVFLLVMFVQHGRPDEEEQHRSRRPPRVDPVGERSGDAWPARRLDHLTEPPELDGEPAERVREHLPNCPAVRKVYVSRSREDIADPLVERLESVIGATNDWTALPPAEGIEGFPQRGPDDDVTIFYTSGTTGKPKGAVVSHRNIISNIWNGASAQARAYLRRPPFAGVYVKGTVPFT